MENEDLSEEERIEKEIRDACSAAGLHPDQIIRTNEYIVFPAIASNLYFGDFYVHVECSNSKSYFGGLFHVSNRQTDLCPQRFVSLAELLCQAKRALTREMAKRAGAKLATAVEDFARHVVIDVEEAEKLIIDASHAHAAEESEKEGKQ